MKNINVSSKKKGGGDIQNLLETFSKNHFKKMNKIQSRGHLIH